MTTPFAARLRAFRRKADVPASVLSLAAGLSPDFVRQLEVGRTSAPSVHRVAAIAEALGVSLDWLLSGQGKEPDHGPVRARVKAIAMKRKRKTKAAA